MEQYKWELVGSMADSQVLKLGEFTLEGGWKSPFFMSMGAYAAGDQLRRLREYYTEAIHNNYGTNFSVLFGPTYKGVPLSVATTIAFSELHDKDTHCCSNQREMKDHDDISILLGSPIKDGDGVVIIEDVTISSRSIGKTFPIIRARSDVTILGLMVSLNRMKRGKGEKSALEEIKELYGFNASAIVSIAEVVKHLYNRKYKGQMIINGTIEAAIDAYYE